MRFLHIAVSAALLAWHACGALAAFNNGVESFPGTVKDLSTWGQFSAPAFQQNSANRQLGTSGTHEGKDDGSQCWCLPIPDQQFGGLERFRRRELSVLVFRFEYQCGKQFQSDHHGDRLQWRLGRQQRHICL